MNNPLFSSETIGTAFGEVNTSIHDNVNQAFNIQVGTSIVADDPSSNIENMDVSRAIAF
jgi:hypothetical protein